LVNQGIAVYGNKGSTDQHAYVQQLCAGVPNFFVVFIEVLKDRRGPSIEVEPRERPRVTSGDYLSGFLQGTRAALSGNGRQSITLTVPEVTPFSVGVLIALFERAVGFYASLVEINAYDQPGVENCKQAANDGLDIQVEVVRLLAELKDKEGPLTAEQIAARLNKPSEAERVFKLCEHLAANPFRGVTKVRGLTPTDSIYCGRASVELAHLP
jgi:glucose-6-phosphate isomerase